MKKKTSKRSSAADSSRDREQTAAFLAEKNLVTKLIDAMIPSADCVSVDPQDKEVSMYLDPSAFDASAKNLSGEGISRKYEKSDRTDMSVTYTYSLV